MKRLFLLPIFFFILSFSLLAQVDCRCCKKRAEGQALFDRKEYQAAIDKWQIGQQLSDYKDKCPELDDLINKARKKLAKPQAAQKTTLSKPVEEKKTIQEEKPPAIIPSDLVFIKGGTFQMGDQFGEGTEDERPVHSVTVSDFYLGKTEVTFDEYDAYCAAVYADKYDDTGWGRGKHPIINVDWYDAIRYCNWRSRQEALTPAYTIDKINKDSTNKSSSDTKKWRVTMNPKANGYRLPTEAEWEYAARERGRKVRFGNGKDVADSIEINFYSDWNVSSIKVLDKKKTVEVGTLSKNDLGLFDMSGNVSEWCNDWYSENFYAESPVENPLGPSTGEYRVCRGGSYYSNPGYVRATKRSRIGPNAGGRITGFRVARGN